MSANSYLGYDELKKVVDELAVRASVAPSAYELFGCKSQGKQFRVQFKGEGNTPTHRANKFAHTLRGKDGWERVSINRPAGSTEQHFIGLNRSENEITKVRNLKVLEKNQCRHCFTPQARPAEPRRLHHNRLGNPLRPRSGNQIRRSEMGRVRDHSQHRHCRGGSTIC